MQKTIQQLQQEISGEVFDREHPAYEQLRRGWELTIDHHPAYILIPHNVADIAAGIRFARASGLAVAVQTTGHGMLYPADDSLLILSSHMKAVEVDVKARTARVEAGVIWQQVLDAATPHGLAPLLGSAPNIGVIGYMLGGGIGWLGRRYGFGADSLRSIDMIGANGELLHCSPKENSDLFWALPGGGGNFGVVTAMEFDLYPVASVYGGNLVYPKESATEALRFYRDWIRTMPDELSSSIGIVKFPPLERVPEAFRGKTLVLVMAAFAGSANEGEQWLQPWLNWQAPMNNTFREMPFSEIPSITNDPVDPMAQYGSSDMFNELSDEAIDVIVHFAGNDASPLTMSMIRHAGGAMGRAPANGNAIGNRSALLYLMMGGATPDAEAFANVKDYVKSYRAALAPYTRVGVWMNFMGGNGSGAQERIKENYEAETYERLLALKAKYDPDNMFRFSYQLAIAATQ